MSNQNSRIARTLLTYLVTTISILFVAVAAAGQQQTQDGAINTTRSNIKNTFPLDGKIDQLTVKIDSVSEPLSGRSIKPVNTPVQIKDGKFNLGVLPAGEYELTIGLGELRTQLGDLAKVRFDPLIVELDGVVGGTLKQELQLDLDSKIGTETARSGKPKFKNVVFKSDGKTPITGRARHDTAKNAIGTVR